MNAKLSLGLFFNRVDSAVLLAAMRGIANRSLGQAIGQAQRIVRERDDENTRTGTGSLDARNEQDIARDDIDPPVGLENRPSAEDLLTLYARIHWAAQVRIGEYATTKYDLPQDVHGRVGFIVDRAREALSTRPLRFATEGEKLAFVAKVSQAEKDLEFWRENKHEVISIVEAALSNAEADADDRDDALDVLEGVEAHQYAVQAGIGIAQTMARLQAAMARFPAGTMLGRQMASEFGALESQLPSLIKFVDELEAAYGNEILTAVKDGRNLLATEAIEQARINSVDRMVEKALAKQHAFRDFAETE